MSRGSSIDRREVTQGKPGVASMAASGNIAFCLWADRDVLTVL